MVDEACTVEGTGNLVEVGVPCKYWLNGDGTINEGSKCLDLGQLSYSHLLIKSPLACKEDQRDLRDGNVLHYLVCSSS